MKVIPTHFASPLIPKLTFSSLSISLDYPSVSSSSETIDRAFRVAVIPSGVLPLPFFPSVSLAVQLKSST